MNKADFCGIYPALVTPFDTEERFLPASFERLLERVYSAGVHGVYVCGQTGEGILQRVEERKKVAEVAVKCSPAGRRVIVHVGAYRGSDAIELARHASRVGAHAVSSLPPLGDYSFAEILSYYRDLAEASDVPLLVYYFPELCPTLTTADQILEVCGLRNVVGLKFTDFNLFKLSALKKRVPAIFNGRDEVLVAGLLMGADGGIGTFYNLVPELFVQLYELAAARQWERARAVQQRINELIEIVLRVPLFPAVKLMLRWSGIDCGGCLGPRRALTASEESELRSRLAESSFAQASFGGLTVP